MRAPGIGLDIGGHPNRPANTAQDQSSNGISRFWSAILTEPKTWPARAEQHPRRAGLPDFTFANCACQLRAELLHRGDRFAAHSPLLE
jgi:hypothetical protein